MDENPYMMEKIDGKDDIPYMKWKIIQSCSKPPISTMISPCPNWYAQWTMASHGKSIFLINHGRFFAIWLWVMAPYPNRGPDSTPNSWFMDVNKLPVIWYPLVNFNSLLLKMAHLVRWFTMTSHTELLPAMLRRHVDFPFTNPLVHWSTEVKKWALQYPYDPWCWYI